MSPLAIWKAASWTARILTVLLLIAMIGWAATAMFGGKSEAARARVAENQAEAAIESGKDAVNTSGNVAAKEQARAESVEATKEEIRNAKTARDGDAAARRGLCGLSGDLCP